MRRTFLGWLFRNDSSRCSNCGRKLTDLEVEYYLSWCEKCEGKAMIMLNKDNEKKRKYRRKVL